MYRIKGILVKRVEALERAIKTAEKDLKHFPPGRLRISASGKQCRYFNSTEENEKKGTYIPKSEIKTVKALAQKDYAERFLKDAVAEKDYWCKVLQKISAFGTDTAYEKLSDKRKALVAPYILPDDKYAQLWQAADYAASPYNAENKKHPTRRGELVRSKSEVMIANVLDDLGIPYRYEQVLRLKDGRIYYPDFTLLDLRTREEVYLEHFGMLDDPQYLTRACAKIHEYEKNGIFPGVNLLTTFETSIAPLNAEITREMLCSFFGGRAARRALA